MIGVFKKSVRDNLSEEIRKQITSWASAVYQKTKGNFGFTDGIAFTMFHGTRGNRMYKRRYEVLRENDFDPETDISLTEGGVWQWSSDKPKLHRYFILYYYLRHENVCHFLITYLPFSG